MSRSSNLSPTAILRNIGAIWNNPHSYEEIDNYTDAYRYDTHKGVNESYVFT